MFFDSEDNVEVVFGCFSNDRGQRSIQRDDFNYIIMCQLSKRVLLLLVILGLTSGACWSQLPLLRTGTFSPISTLTPYTVNASTFTVTFTSLINSSAPLYWGLGLVGYNSYLTQTFSFNVTMSVLNNTGIAVIAQPQDGTYMMSLKLCYIVTALSPTVAPRMAVLSGCFKCLTISQSLNTSSPSRSESFIQNSPLTYSSSIQLRSFLFAFNTSNTYGTINYLQVDTTYVSNGTNGTFKHTVTTKEYNNINYVCLSIVAWNTADNQFGNGAGSIFQAYTLDNAIKSSFVSYKAVFDCSNLIFMGFSTISHLMGGARLLGVYPESYTNFTTSFDSNANFSSAILNIFYVGSLLCNGSNNQIYTSSSLICDVTCLAPYYANVSNNCVPCNTTCFTCNYSDPNVCTSCIALTNRTGTSCTCSGIYFSNSSDPSVFCLLCSDYIPYCTSCTNSSVCLACSSGKFLVNGTCKCFNVSTPTYYVTGVCLTYPGCVIANSNTNANYCSSCNTTAHFQYFSASNLTCVCSSGYNNSDNPLICAPICGDGTVNDEECDDGNKTNGDGCSSTCKVESGWYCYVDTGTTGPSKCLQISSSASITYLYAERVVGTNTAILYFSFLPTGISMPTDAFQGTVSSTAPLASVSSTYTSSTSRIALTVEFISNLENNAYSFTFNFTNAKVFYSSPLTVNAKTTGVNEQLILQSYGVLVKTMQYALMGTSLLALILGAVTSAAGYKLMGLELLLPMQASFFAEFALANPPPYVSSLKALKYSLGYNQLIPYDYGNYYRSSTKLPKFDFQIEMALNLNVMAAVLAIGTLVLLILQIIYLYRYSRAYNQQLAKAPPPQENKKGTKGKKEEKVAFSVKEEGELGLALKSARENRNTFVNNFYFYLSVAVTQETIFCFIIQNSQVSVISFYLSEDLNMMAGYIALVLVFGNMIFMFCQLGEKKDQRIISFQETRVIRYPIFLIFSSVVIAVVMSVTFTLSFASYIATLLSALPLAGLVYYRPYRNDESYLNAVCAFVDLAMPLVASVIYLFNNLVTLPELGWLLSAVVMIVWVMAVDILTIIRMIKIIPWRQLPLVEKCMKKKKKSDEQLLEKNKDKAEIEMSNIVKNSIKEEVSKNIDWQERNKKEYQSISSKPDNQEDEQASDHNQEEDELVQIKRRLRKEIMNKKAF